MSGVGTSPPILLAGAKSSHSMCVPWLKLEARVYEGVFRSYRYPQGASNAASIARADLQERIDWRSWTGEPRP